MGVKKKETTEAKQRGLPGIIIIFCGAVAVVDSTVCYLHTMCADIHYRNNKQYALVVLFFSL